MKYKLIITTTLISLLLSSCFIGTDTYMEKTQVGYSEESGGIPPSFGENGNETLLIILKERFSYDKYLKKATKENYFGPFLFISEEELTNTVYADYEQYPYYFDYDDGTLIEPSEGLPYTLKQFYVMDRSNEKKYKSGAEYAKFYRAISGYMRNLETKRLTNQ